MGRCCVWFKGMMVTPAGVGRFGGKTQRQQKTDRDRKRDKQMD